MLFANNNDHNDMNSNNSNATKNSSTNIPRNGLTILAAHQSFGFAVIWSGGWVHPCSNVDP